MYRKKGIKTVCEAYDNFNNTNTSREMLKLILKENSFQFDGKNYLQTPGTVMGTKMAVAFTNIFSREILSQSVTKPTVWKRYIDDVVSLWDLGKRDISSNTSSNRLTHITLQLNSQQKSQTPKLHFWIQ